MKKLLAMLTTITSLSSMTPIILANASAKIAENKIVNNEINYQQKNNLETLKRSKRNNNINAIQWEIKKNPEDNNFLELINETINFLINRNIVVSTTYNSDGSSTRPYALNNHLDDNNIFIIPISIQNNIINLVFRSRDLYLQGYGITFERDTTSYYLIHNHETINSYYHFDDSTIRSIGGYRSKNLGFSGNYSNLSPNNHFVSWSEMYESFINLISFQGHRNNITGNISIEGSLTNIIFYTSESLRFNSIRNLINQRFFSNRYRIEEGDRLAQTNSIIWYDDNIHNIVNNWGRNSEQFYNRIKLLTNVLTELPNQISILYGPGALAFFNFSIRDYNNRNYNKRIRRDLNNNELCSSANDLTPVYNYNDYFQVDYYFLCHDVIKINLAKDTAIKIKEVFYLKNKVTFKEYLISLFKKIRQLDEAGNVLGGILDSDYEKSANFIWEHFSHFNEKLCDLINSNFYTYIFFETNRNEKWDENKIILV